MNGYVVAWMALSPFAGPSLAIGVLAGRKLQHRESYQTGLEVGRMMAEYQQSQRPVRPIDAAQVERWQQMMAGRVPGPGVVGGHGHDGPCSSERGCW